MVPLTPAVITPPPIFSHPAVLPALSGGGEAAEDIAIASRPANPVAITIAAPINKTQPRFIRVLLLRKPI
jgi:hypothetical protein